MLIIWHDLLTVELRRELATLDPFACYWPFGIYRPIDQYLVTDWWIHFSTASQGLLWVIRYTELVEVRYRE